MRHASSFLFAYLLALMSPVGLMTPATAQEPAFLSTVHAVRYEESPGWFHYVFPCLRSTLEGTDALPDPPPARPALCWLVRSVRLKVVDGKVQTSGVAEGLLKISADLVSFEPVDPKDSELKDSFPAAKASYEKVPGKEVHLVGTPELSFDFAFTHICDDCDPQTPFTPNEDRLAAEYRLVADSLAHFDEVAKRVRDLAARTLVDIAPQNQPGADDDRAAWTLYASLDQQLADRCDEAAKSCARQYAVYQTCKAHDPAAQCGGPPACKASCVLPPEAAREIKATVCISHQIGGATLLPDWTATLNTRNAGPRAQQPFLLTAADEPESQRSSCAVKDGIEEARLRSAQPVVAGIMGMSAPNAGVSGGVVGGMLGATGPPVMANSLPRGGMTRVSAGVIADNLLVKTVPVYPAVAVAAHISGAVVLHAIISKTGTVDNLTVISGPEMLRASALEAVRTWRYKPYLLMGQPVMVDTQITVNFNFGPGPDSPAAATDPAGTAPTPGP